MKKVNKVLNILLATLFCFLAIQKLNNANDFLGSYPFYYEDINEEYEILQLSLNTNNDQLKTNSLKDVILKMFETYPYDGYVQSMSSTTRKYKDEMAYSIYVYPSKTIQPDGSIYSHLTFDTVNPIQYHSLESSDYLTNDLNDTNAYARVKQPTKINKEVKDFFGNQSYQIYPWTKFEEIDISEVSSYTIRFYVPISEIEAFKKEIYEDFSQEFGCTTDMSNEIINVCGSGVIGVDSGFTYVSETLDFINISNLLTFPTSLVFITFAATIVVLFYQSLVQKRELTVRIINGNTPIKIYKEVFLPVVVSPFLYFAVTSGIISFLFVNFDVGLSSVYLKKVLTVIACYFLISLLLSIIFFLVFYITQGSIVLKKDSNARISLWMSYLLKIGIIVALLVPLSKDLEALNNSKQYLKHFDSSMLYKTGKIVSIYEDSTFNAEDSEQESRYIFELMTRHGLDYLNFDYFGHIAYEENTNFIIVNKNFLSKFQIMKSDGTLLNTDEMNHDVLIGTQNNLDLFHNPSIQTIDKIAVDYTLDALSIVSGIYAKNPVVYVLTSYENPVLSLGNYSIVTDQNDIQEFITEVNEVAKVSEIIKIEDMREYMSDKYESDQIKVYLEFFSFLIMLIIFSTLAITAFFEINRKKLAVEYLHGIAKIRRYRELIVFEGVSLTLSYVLLFMINQHQSTEIVRFVDTQIIVSLCVLIAVIDFAICSIYIRKFEKEQTSIILKGSI